MNELTKRVLKEAEYIINTRKTIREAATIFGISKSTIHKDLKERLPVFDKNKAALIKEIMQQHIDTRHIKGGQSTKNKYKNIK